MNRNANVDACLQALSGWGLADLWMVLSQAELGELGAMLADRAAGVPTAAHANPAGEQRVLPVPRISPVTTPQGIFHVRFRAGRTLKS